MQRKDDWDLEKWKCSSLKQLSSVHIYKLREDLVLQCSYIVNPKWVGTYTFYNMHCFLGQCTHTIKNSEKE